MKNKFFLFTILVLSSLNITNKNSSTIYAENKPSGVEELFTLPSSVTMEEGASLPSYVNKVNYNGKVYNSSDVKALKFQTDGNSKNATITYNKIIDLSKSDGNYDLFSFLITTSSGLLYDSKPLDDVSKITPLYETRYFHIKLTDIYNPKVYMQFDLERRQDRKDLCSFRVSTNTHKSGGYYPSQSYVATSPYGSPLISSFTGTPAKADNTYNVISSYYDSNNKDVYAYPFFSNETKEVSRGLTNPKHLLDSDNLWDGFTTGEVKLSFEFDTISEGKKATIYLFGLNGISYIGDTVKDTLAPNIYLDDKATTNGIPEAEINKSYRLFNAKAYDLYDGVIAKNEIKKQVIYKYGTLEQKYINIKNDSFIPTLPGEYTIRYTCKDMSNNEGELLVKVNAKICLAKLNITVNNLKISEVYETGDYLNISKDYLITGGSNHYTTEIYVLNNKTNEKVIINENKYQLNQQGYFTLVYCASDYIGDKVYYKVNFKVNIRKIPLIKLPSLPNVLTDTNSFMLPQFEAFDYYSFNNTIVDAKKYYLVSNDNISFKKQLINDSITPNGKKLYIKACAKNIIDSSLKYESEVQEINIIHPTSIGSYFYNDKDLITMDYKDYEAPKYTFNEDVDIDFANQITFADFRLFYSVPEELSNYNTININLKDVEDSDNVLNITLIKKDANTINIFLNDEFVFEYNGSFSSLSGYDLTVSGSNLYINYVKICQINDFLAKKVYARISCKNVKAQSAIKFWAISSQSYTGAMDDEKFDILGPSIILEKEIPLVSYVGNELIIPKADIWDALQSSCSVEVSIEHNEQIIYSANDASKERKIRIDDIGNYFLTYKAYDSLNNVSTSQFQIKSINYERPYIKINNYIPLSSNLNTNVVLPTAAAFDKKGNNIDVNILVYQPNGKQIELTNNSFTASYIGKYTIKYIAVGSDYKMNVIEYVMEVK